MSGITLWRWDKITKSEFIFSAFLFSWLSKQPYSKQTNKQTNKQKESHRTVKVQQIFIVQCQRHKREVIVHAHTG